MERRLVYDSDAVHPGRCPICAKRRDRCSCVVAQSAATEARRATAPNLPRDGVVRLLRDTKRRGGKTVTIITGLSGSTRDMAGLVSELKRMCGTGGTLRGDVVEIRGDLRERLKVELEKRGYTVKIAGG